jgi:hypothetical protein
VLKLTSYLAFYLLLASCVQLASYLTFYLIFYLTFYLTFGFASISAQLLV